MKHFALLLAASLPLSAVADTFDRPIPQAQSATAEVWFGFASLALIAALVLVGRMVARR